MKLSGNFLDEIKRFKTIYCLISGGYHSTTAALLLKDSGFENVVLLHNRTYLETKESLDTIQKVIFETDYAYNVIEPNLKNRVGNIIKESFESVELIAYYLKNNLQNYRDFITCCTKLKKSPARRWYTKEIDKVNDVIISSLCPYESRNRARWLSELRKKNTYIRLHGKMGKVYYAYPFRDNYSVRPFHEYLLNKGYFPEHSGCLICPIRVGYMLSKNTIYDCPDIRYYNKIKKRDGNINL